MGTLNIYLYGMRLRGFSPGCQPMDGYLDRLSDSITKRTRYHDLLLYDRRLTEEECDEFGLDPVAAAERG